MVDKEELKLIQRYELDILKYIDKVCNENNLKYYLAYGTLLGAVRHNGFIPWDDDIDIYMTRPDYIKLLEIVKRNPHERYKLCSVDNEKLWTAPLPKVIDTYTLLKQEGHREKMDLGLYIDIFVLDGVPSDTMKCKLWMKQLNVFHKIWVGCEYVKNINKNEKFMIKGYLFKIISKLLNICIGANFAAKILCKYARRYSYEKNELIGDNECQTKKDREKCIYQKNWIEGDNKILFEDLECYIPTEWNEILTRWYGEYMKLPDINDQIPHHKYELKLLKNNKNK